jgi:hypothetical protein
LLLLLLSSQGSPRADATILLLLVAAVAAQARSRRLSAVRRFSRIAGRATLLLRVAGSTTEQADSNTAVAVAGEQLVAAHLSFSRS